MVPAEAVQSRGVGKLARGAVGLGGVKVDFTTVADGSGDHSRHVGNGMLDASTYIDEVGALDADIASDKVGTVGIDVFKHIDTCRCHIHTPQEFAQRCAGAPKGQ